MVTWYDILEVSPNASKEVIDRAYKALAKRHHPDLNPIEIRLQCEEHMKMLNQARDILTNAELRKQYDEDLYSTKNQETNYSPNVENPKKQKTNEGEIYNRVPRPWVRYFARMFDLYIG